MRIIEEQIIASLQRDSVGLIAGKPLRQEGRPQQICLLQPVNLFGRSQPVSVELLPIGHPSVEMLCLKTPLGGAHSLQPLVDKYPIFQFPYEEEYPMVKMCLDESCPADDPFSLYMRIDLPLLQPVDGQNPLSDYEINEALRDLVECGDLVERLALSGQDLHLADPRNGNSIQSLNQEKQLRSEVFREPLGGNWQQAFNPKYVYLTEHRSVDLSLRELWLANHQQPFAKYSTVRNGTEITLSYFAKDFQQAEQAFLGRRFEELLMV